MILGLKPSETKQMRNARLIAPKFNVEEVRFSGGTP
jgi:hypothetical protein